jgi:DNA-binding response OmpR family regulator
MADEAARDYIPNPVRRGNRETKMRPTRMLSISPISDDYDVLSGMLEDQSWQLFPATTCQDAIARLGRTRISVILCEHSLPDGTWKDVLDHVSGAGIEAPIIVTSRLADEHLWAEVLNLGGYDVLAKPFSEREVRHAITSALLRSTYPPRRARAAGGA